ncbi:MAG: phosphorylase [Candidatus Abyssobacteria bacterium SURF_5]|uniref:Phosphorylase n=1 Tax=Abyssobacteria bacterium (strain SURF_5) TaxID=2093360 RepID=A0A3A4NQA0_ABYX5|nr:MAG: phosphorylase [Candidatus Abyssubacteria bacterium SURF_5]
MPRFAVIGGSQAFRFLDQKSGRKTIGPLQTPFGKSQPVHLIRSNDSDYLFLSRHGETGYSVAASFVNYRANIYALKDLGVRQIIAWSGPGAITVEFAIGQFIVIDDIIDETRRRPATFYEHGGLGFIRQNPVFCPHLRGLLEQILADLGLKYDAGGTYVCTEGPRLETPAEIRKFAAYGAHLVGMTLAPEVFLARELEICYAALCYVTNYAEGIRKKPFRPGILFEGLTSEAEFEAIEASVKAFPAIAGMMAKATRNSEPTCSCASLMQRYRDRGVIGENWREWIRT